VPERTGSLAVNWDDVQASVGAAVGPGSAVNNDLAAFDGTTGKLLKDTGILYTDITATPGASKIVRAGAGGTIAAGWMSEVLAITDLSDVNAKSGSGTTAVFNLSPTIDAPIISGQPSIMDWTNASHTHINAAQGGQLGTAGLQDDAVTYAKIQNMTTARILGRTTAASGDVEELTVSSGLEFVAVGGGIQRSALTGDVTAAAGSNATTITDSVPKKRRLIQILKDPGAATFTALGIPAPTLSGATVSNADDAYGPLCTFISGTLAGDAAGIISADFTRLRADWEPDLVFEIETHSGITNSRYNVGIFSATPIAVADLTLLHGAVFRYDSVVDGTANWRVVTNDGGVTPTTTEVSSIVSSTRYRLRIQYLSATPSVLFYINDVLAATHTADLPTASQLLGYGSLVTNIAGGTARRTKCGRIAMAWNR
jgi:hypothetical protein